MRSRFKPYLLLALLFFVLSSAFAAGFNATVEDNKINYGESVQLKLMLDDAKATGHIDLSPLAKDFTIYNQQQFSTYSNTNGHVRAESGWNVTLMPKKIGEFTIPSLDIETDRGLLKSNEIQITVQQVKPGANGGKDSIGISLVSTVNKTKVFVNEPVIYTLKIISYKPIANVVLDDIKSNDAIIEKIGEPKQYDQTHGGVRAHIIEIRYAVTALKAGVATIAPANMHGELQVPTQAQRTQRFGMFNNFFMDNMFELKPFSLQSEAITIDVLPPAAKATNWLPLNSLTLSQSWDNGQEVKVGDTITRKVKIVAKGAFAKQLPTVKDYMPQNGVKIYANKPTFTENFDSNSDTIVGIREEEYSIVPQEDGVITFPEIQIKWWNLNTKKLEVSTLPAKTVQIMPNANNTAPGVTLDYSIADQPQQVAAPVAVSKNINISIMLYAVIGALIGIGVTIGLVLLFIFLRKRPVKIKLKVKHQEEEIVVKDAHDLRRLILQYAIKHWHVPSSTTLNKLGDALANNNYTYDMELYSMLSKYVNAGIYANVIVELEILMAQWEEFKKSVIKNKRQTVRSEKSSEDYASLNPT